MVSGQARKGQETQSSQLSKFGVQRDKELPVAPRDQSQLDFDPAAPFQFLSTPLQPTYTEEELQREKARGIAERHRTASTGAVSLVGRFEWRVI